MMYHGQVIMNGKKAMFDTMSVPEFVMGYCRIIVSLLPFMSETKIALDHLDYLTDMMSHTEGGDWELVKNSHRQILHMVEQGQL